MLSKNRKIKKRGRFQKIFLSVLVGIFLCAIILFLVVSSLKINQKRAEMTEKIENLKKEIQLFSERNEQLKAGIIQTESDDYWEARLYEQGYKKPGEEAIVVIPPGEKGEKDIQEDKNFWDNLREMFGF